MFRSYNAFSNLQTMRENVNSFYDKLKFQDTETLGLVMDNWDGERMPNAAQLLAKCRILSKNNNVEKNINPSDLLCKYSDYCDENECETSARMCSNLSDSFRIDADRINFCLNFRPDKKIICYWHERVLVCKAAKLRFENGGLEPTYSEKWTDWVISNALTPIKRDLSIDIGQIIHKPLEHTA